MSLLAQEELEREVALHSLEPELQLLLLPSDPNDERNIFLEIRAGTGGAGAFRRRPAAYVSPLRRTAEPWQAKPSVKVLENREATKRL